MTARQHARRSARAIATAIARPPFVPDGHFYSPVPARDDVERAVARRDAGTAVGVDVRADAQSALWEELLPLLPVLPTRPDPMWRYQGDNGMYGIPDALLHAASLRRFRPRRVVEVGSGYTSALVLDVSERYELDIELTCIEPYPARLKSLLRAGDDRRVRLIPKPVQDVEAAVFDRLEDGDLLFIDSTHVSKAGSDVNRLFLEVIPALNAGVRVHVHDIFWPFEYPEAWLRDGRALTEAYLLQCFLMFNSRWQIELFGSWLWQQHPEARKVLTSGRYEAFAGVAEPGSIWLRQTT